MAKVIAAYRLAVSACNCGISKIARTHAISVASYDRQLVMAISIQM